MRAREGAALRERRAISGRCERFLLLRGQEQLLAEERHLARLLALVERNELVQRVDRGRGTQGPEVLVQVGLELVEEDFVLAGVHLRRRRDVGGIDDHRAARFHVRDRLVHQAVGHGAVAEVLFARDAKARALQRAGVETPGVVTSGARGAPLRRRIARVDAGHRAEEQRRVGDGSGHGSRGVLAVRNGNNPAAAHETNRRLDADQSVGAGWTDDGPVGLGADANRRKIGGNRRPGTRARSARVAIEVVGVLHKSPAAAPPARRMRRPEVRPLAQVRLAENHDAGRAEALHHERVARRLRALERERSRGCHHPVGGVDVVLDQDGNAVQRPARTLGSPFRVERIRDGQRVRVHFDDSMQSRTAPVDLVDAPEIQLGDLARRIAPRRHPRLELRGGDFFERERGRGGPLDSDGKNQSQSSALDHGARLFHAFSRSTIALHVRADGVCSAARVAPQTVPCVSPWA